MTIPLPDVQLGPIHLGPFPIRWYALAYIFGLLIGWWYAVKLATTAKLWGDTEKGPLSRADIDDFAFFAMIGILVGGRLGYILFYTLPYEPAKLGADPMFIFRMWEGGMSFHGGLIGAALAVAYTTWARKLSIFNLGDVACAAAPIGLCFGRLANFINGELYGRETNVPWAMRFPVYDWNTRTWGPVDGLPLVHPSQLYEASLEGVLLFTILAVAIWRFGTLKKPGLTAGIFLIGYAACRTFVENFRQPDPFVHGLPDWITMGMLLSIPMVGIGAWLIWRAVKKPDSGEAKPA
ncbi:MAG TPA: prolipoprotein diacylglyceryl transferase [Hyphomonadaceae bacterium]|nr:prolipoprotein diacylglyceryl transferase [Hyphomonadaceae bacterium]